MPQPDQQNVSRETPQWHGRNLTKMFHVKHSNHMAGADKIVSRETSLSEERVR